MADVVGTLPSVSAGQGYEVADMGTPVRRGGSTRPVLTGCDLQPVDDVRRAVDDFGDRYLDRVYTAAEQDSYRTGGAASLAARFAGKEAVLKLVGRPDGIDPRTVEILTDAAGRPQVRLGPAIARAAREAHVGPIDISLSHTRTLAMAVAVAAHDGLDRPDTTSGQEAIDDQ